MNRLIDVFSLAERDARLDGQVPLALFERLAGSLAAPAGDVSWAWQGFRDVQGRPAARLRLASTLVLRCDRCNATLTWPLDTESTCWFVRTERELAALPVDDAPDEPLLGSSQFDLLALIEDELILALPLSPRHGRCPVTAGDAVAGADRPDAADAESAPDAGATAPAEASPRTHRPFAALASWRDRKLSRS